MVVHLIGLTSRYAPLPQATGIAPEYVNFVEGKDLVAAPGAPFYILRPETAESLFVLNQLTKEPM